MGKPPIGFIGCVMGDSGRESRTPVEPAFSPPSDVKFFGGEGASVEDVKRGYLDPSITEAPEYDRKNYVDRWSEPKGSMRDDYEFRNKDCETRGMFTRPRFPNER